MTAHHFQSCPAAVALRRYRQRRPLLAAALLWALALLLSVSGSVSAQEEVVHDWQRLYYGSLDGKQRLLFAGRFERAKPALGDVDGDGDLDLVVGTANGTLMVFANEGDRKQPRFRLVNETLGAQPSNAQTPDVPVQPIVLRGNAAPALVDIDGDSDLDLFVGDSEGKLRYYENVGNPFLALFRLRNPDVLGRNFGLNLVPRFADVDGDGAQDLALGNETGAYFLVPNDGTRLEARFCTAPQPRQDCLKPMVQLGQLDPEDNAVPAWVDWDGDGDPDLMVGKSDGTVAYFQNVGSPRAGAWEARDVRFNLLDIGSYAAPLFADLNGDEVPDLLLAGNAESVAYYTRNTQPGGFALWLENKNVLRVAHLGGQQTRVHAAAGDLNADGSPDVVIGTRSGELLVYASTGKDAALSFHSAQGPLLPTPQRAYSAPALVDIDGDGDLDLIVGDRSGRLELIENTGDAKRAEWRSRSLFFAEVDVGALSVPAFRDLDGDGDPDLIVGNSLGNVILYENTGTPQRAAFTLRSIRFGSLALASNAAPALFPWNPDGPPDLVVGNQAGTLVPATRNPDLKLVAEDSYQPAPAPWNGLRAPSYSAPLFADMTGDGKPDLLLGTGGGAVLLWRLEASHKRQLMAGQQATGTGTGAAPQVAGMAPPGSSTEAVPAIPGQPGAQGGPLPLDPLLEYEPSALERIQVGRNTKPAFLDITGDGRPDLVLGTAAGRLYLYEQTGDIVRADWRQLTDSLAGYQHGRNAAPTFQDLDGDDRPDLIVGNETGRIYRWRNTGRNGLDRFAGEPETLVVRSGKNAVPALADLSGDGRPDLLVGDLKGDLMYFQARPDLALAFQLVVRRMAGMDVGVNASPAFADLTRQGRAYLLLGSDKGQVRVYAPTGTNPLASSGWRENPGYLQGLDMPMGSHPTAADVDGDGDLDLVVGSDAGGLRFFRNNAILNEGPTLSKR